MCPMRVSSSAGSLLGMHIPRTLRRGRSVLTASSSLRTPAAMRSLHMSSVHRYPPAPPPGKDRGPPSTEETQTDFKVMDIFSNIQPPTTAVNACIEDGFALDSGLKVSGGGVVLLGGEAFKWCPWRREGHQKRYAGADGAGDGDKRAMSIASTLQNAKGQFDVDKHAWGLLDLVWPKPDLLIVGTGARILPLSPETRKNINDLGIRIEVQDTRNAAAQFNMLATERGVHQIAAALIPVGWRIGR